MSQNAEKAKSNLIPFTVHAQLMRGTRQQLAYPGGDVAAWRAAGKAKLAALLGLDKMPSPCPLDVRSVWKRRVEHGSIEKIVFAVEDGCDANAYLCLPDNAQAPYPFFICLQGHSTGAHVSVALDQKDDSKPLAVEGDRDFAHGCLRRGVACLCLEQRGFGEREDSHQGVPRCQNPAVHALMLGRTLLGERVYDVDRAIDYLLSRGDADPARIGVMGNSGGGTTSMFAGATLDRLTHVMPSCAFSSFAASIMAMDHCLCNYVPNLLLWFEAADVVGLCAPKTLVVVNGCEDEIFPLKEAVEGFAKVKRIYTMAGAADRCRHVVGEGGHRFYAGPAWDAMLEYLS